MPGDENILMGKAVTALAFADLAFADLGAWCGVNNNPSFELRAVESVRVHAMVTGRRL